jgi:putative oxidoreductase
MLVDRFVVAPALALTLIPITVTTHLGNPGHVGPLFKNVALFGGLIHFAVRAAGAYALDGKRERGPGPYFGKSS